MAARQKVFLSSTLRDLREYRYAVITVLGQFFGMEVMKNELMDASQYDPLTTLNRMIDECDIFIGVYAHRYGKIPQGQQASYIELEYGYAKSMGKTSLCFFLDINYPWPSE